MGGRVAIDQLYVDAQPVAPALNAPLQRVAHVQIAADLPEIDCAALVDEGGLVADHERARNARKISGEALSDAVGKIFLFVIAADICKGEHDQRKPRRARDRLF